MPVRCSPTATICARGSPPGCPPGRTAAGAPPTRSRSKIRTCGSASSRRSPATRSNGVGRGHSGDPDNERADQLARAAISAARWRGGERLLKGGQNRGRAALLGLGRRVLDLQSLDHPVIDHHRVALRAGAEAEPLASRSRPIARVNSALPSDRMFTLPPTFLAFSQALKTKGSLTATHRIASTPLALMASACSTKPGGACPSRWA